MQSVRPRVVGARKAYIGIVKRRLVHAGDAMTRYTPPRRPMMQAYYVGDRRPLFDKALPEAEAHELAAKLARSGRAVQLRDADTDEWRATFDTDQDRTKT